MLLLFAYVFQELPRATANRLGICKVGTLETHESGAPFRQTGYSVIRFCADCLHTRTRAHTQRIENRSVKRKWVYLLERHDAR